MCVIMPIKIIFISQKMIANKEVPAGLKFHVGML